MSRARPHGSTDAVLHAFSALLRAEAHGVAPPSLRLSDEAWGRLSERIRAHRLPAGLAGVLREAGAPAQALDPVEEDARRHRLRIGFLLLELRRALAALELAGCSPVVLKGAALVHTLGRPRFFADLDVLVPRPALPAASAALAGIGYVPQPTLRDRAFYERHHFHHVLRTPGGVAFELHWALGRPSDYYRFDPGGVLARSRTVPFDGVAMRVPSEPDQLVHAASQCLREGFADGRRVLDAARLLLAGAAADPGLAARARAERLSTALWILLRLSDELAGVAAPALEEALRPGRARRTSLEALHLPRLLLDQDMLALPGLKAWLILMCAPGVGVTAATFVRNAFPGERGLLDDGHRVDALPGPMHRLVLGGKRIGQAIRVACYQAARLRARRSAAARPPGR
jgi:hypothetical protein